MDDANGDGFVDRLIAVVGPVGVLTERSALEQYETEWHRRYHGRARLVVRPATTEQVAAVVCLCAGENIAIIPQGGNTGLCEGAMPDESGKQIVLSLARLNRIRAIDPLDFTMTVEAGCVLQNIQEEAERAGCYFPLSLGAQGSCQIGGNISTNAGGVGVLRYGSARSLVLGLEVVLPDGTIWNGLRALGKDNTGYDLRQLFIGAEGTIGIITAAVLKLFPQPLDIQTAFVALSDLEAAVPLLRRARTASSDQVTAFEMLPRLAIELAVRHIPAVIDPMDAPHEWYVLMDLSTSRPNASMRDAMESLLADAVDAGEAVDAVIANSIEQRRALWRIREELPEATRKSGAVLHHDVSVPISDTANFIRRTHSAVTSALPGARPLPFGHIGDGNIHFCICQPQGMADSQFYESEQLLTPIVFDMAMALRGSFSAEHGIGRLKLDELEKYKSAVDLKMMRRLKEAFDPRGLMNPGKIVRHSDVGERG